MDPTMDVATHNILDCQQDDNNEVSLAERHSSFTECSTSDQSSSIIHINNTNPSADWQLPAILPRDVYKLSGWKYFAYSQIKVSSVDISFSDNQEPAHINLLDKCQIDWAKEQGYKYTHLGAIRLGLGPLVRPYLPIYSLCVSIDTRHTDFAHAIIGGFTAPLHNGPAFGTIFPKYSVSLDDTHIYDLLKAFILPQGFRMMNGSRIMQLKSLVCVRFGNDTLPPLRSRVHESSRLQSRVVLRFCKIQN